MNVLGRCVAAAALLIAAVIQPATANDRSECRQGMGDEKMAACANLLGLNPNGPFDYDNHGVKRKKVTPLGVIAEIVVVIVGNILLYRYQQRHPNRGYWMLRGVGIKLRRWRLRPERLVDAVERRRRERSGPPP